MAVTISGIGMAATRSRCASAARALAASSCCACRSRSSCASMSLKPSTSTPISSALSQCARRLWSPVRRTVSTTPDSLRSGSEIWRAT
jgi:hypothetical protein